jgi:hypothetical protein
MWTLVIAMLVILVLAGLVVLYVAFPHRGEDVPAAPWLGDAMRKGVDSAPTLDNTAEEPAHPEAEPDNGTLGFTFSESEPTGPTHRDG